MGIKIEKCMANPDLAMRNVLICAYAYYELDENLLSDLEYDAMFRFAKANKDKLVHPHKELFIKYGCSDDGQSSSLVVPEDEWPTIIKEVAAKLVKEKNEKMV